MTDKEYLASLKAGDVVWQVAYHRYGKRRPYSISKATVARITPIGQIVLDHGGRFKSNGNSIGYSSRGAIATPKEANEARELIREINLFVAVDRALKQIQPGPDGTLTQDQHDKAMALIEQLKEVLA